MTGRTAMTNERFADIAIGTPVSTLEDHFGKPATIKSNGRRQQVYEYLERVNMGTDTVQLRRYYFVITDGKVVGKYVRFSNDPAYQEIYENIYPSN